MTILINCQKIVYIRNKKNLGVSTAWNQGIKKSIDNNAIYFLMSNNDITFRPDSINNLTSIQKQYNLQWVSAIDSQRCFNTNYLDYQLRDQLWEGLCNSCFLITKLVIDKVGYFDQNFYPAYLEDMDFIHRTSLAGLDKKASHMCIVKHNEGSTGRNNNWKLTEECNTSAKLFEFAYIKGKAYFKNKWGFCPD